MNHWVERTAAALATIPAWSPEVRCLDLAEEAGELARAVLVVEGHKTADGEEPVGTALCGVLFDVFALAECYGIDLDACYGEQLEQLANRLNRAGTQATRDVWQCSPRPGHLRLPSRRGH